MKHRTRFTITFPRDPATGREWAHDERNAMRALNGQRLFDHTRTLGKAWWAARSFDASVTKRYAQALIDLFELDPAEKLLTDALGEARKAEAGAQAKYGSPGCAADTAVDVER